jgi:hypothetical protein
MTFFGITDPWIIAAYLGCFLTVIFCCAWGLLKKDKTYTDEGEE